MRERTRIGKLKEALQKAEADGDRLQEKARGYASRVAELDAAVNQAKFNAAIDWATSLVMPRGGED